ncbi:hypothetical protein RSOLAG22IIIB_08130 [Rhizoctonia solani]|uniref:Uncharacterized protein n=1 Tax=Rhizoctonia solani TaxID=456999 RepID=A0A0K6FRR7_9AGAM|nr:hypothetical protein RSOLAG22IIIB_08130 [Rhizoctonia solani]
MEAPRNRRNSALRAPPSSSNEQAYEYPIRSLEDIKPAISFATKLRDAVASLCKLEVLLHILAVYLAFVGIPKLYSKVSCRLPVLPQYFTHCTHELGHPRNPVVIPAFIELGELQSRLGYVMEDSTHSSLIAIDMKDSEMALQDLDMLVRDSSISNKELGRNLELFIEEVEATSGGLQQFGNHIWGAVGRTMSENEYTITMLESIYPETPKESSGIISLMSFGQATTATQKKTQDLWLRTTGSFNKTLHELTHQARTSIGSLEMLEISLGNIQDMTVREEDTLRGLEQGFKRRWFPDEKRLGSNSASYMLLLQVQDHCEHALKYTRGVLSKLEELSNGLSDLGSRESIITSSYNISIRTHIENIRNVTERLQHGQVHMKNVEDTYSREKFSPNQPSRIEFWALSG